MGRVQEEWVFIGIHNVRGRRYFAGYSYVTKRTPVYGTRRIFNGYKKVYKRVPTM